MVYLHEVEDASLAKEMVNWEKFRGIGHVLLVSSLL
jgi:hypothetical protein